MVESGVERRPACMRMWRVRHAHNKMESVAVITGANSGIGLALAHRLLRELAPANSLRLCLACRNIEKAEAARQELLVEHPEAQIDLLQVDVSKPQSAIEAARELKKRYAHINWLYCNAGIMPTDGINVSAFWPPTLSNYVRQFSTGGDFLRYIDHTTPDGLQAVFATNVFGHYLMIRELEEHLASQGVPCNVIWTSSNSAKNVEKIDFTNIQHKNGNMSYPYSKRIVDVLCIGLNKELNNRGIYFTSTCPGLVLTNITLQILPKFVWLLLIFPLLFFIRSITNFFTFKAINGAEALVWLASQDPAAVDHSLKYFSRTTALGRTYILREKVEVEDGVPEELVKQLDKLSDKF